MVAGQWRLGAAAAVVGAGFFFNAFPSVLGAQVVTGRTVDASTNEPVQTAEVALLDEAGAPVALAVTDSTGWFRMQARAAGMYTLEALGPGYETLTVDSVVLPEGEAITVELRLGPRPFELSPLEVVGRRPMISGPLRDYYYRVDQHRLTGRGIVLTREDLTEKHGQSARGVLREQPFLKESSRGGPSRILLKRRGITDRFQGDYCEPDYFLDGQPVDALGVIAIPVSDLEGLEVYRGVSEVPPYFQRSDNAFRCGVILAWTRRG